jgi:hypothetical protein
MEGTYFVIIVLSWVMAIGCTTTDYVGKTYSKTDCVEIFFNTDEIKREYEVMGQI